MDFDHDARSRKSVYFGTKIHLIGATFAFLALSLLTVTYLLYGDHSEATEVWNALPEEHLAPRLLPSKLMSLPLASGDDLYTIPKYIHQSWMNDKLPMKMSRWSQTCRAQHQDWQWVLWTDQDNTKMVEEYFPWFLDTYRALPAEINRADASRNMYMYMFGGVYADLDTECLQPFNQLYGERGILMTEGNGLRRPEQIAFKNSSQVALFGRMNFDGTDDTLYHTVPNAWMSASPGHPFFLLVLQRLKQAVTASLKNRHKSTAEDLTGPVALYHALQEYSNLLDSGSTLTDQFADNPSYEMFNRSSIHLRMELLPPENVYPYSWNNQGKPFRSACWVASRNYNSVKCKEQVTTNQSYAITYWSHTWDDDPEKTHNKNNMKAVDYQAVS